MYTFATVRNFIYATCSPVLSPLSVTQRSALGERQSRSQSLRYPCPAERENEVLSFSSPEPTILLACGRDRELWRDPIFWACAEYSFRILNQSDLLDLTISPWIADFRCWTKPELSIPATGQKDRGLWGREWSTLGKSVLNNRILVIPVKLRRREVWMQDGVGLLGRLGDF